MARFTPAFLDELRARVTLSAVIGRDVTLTKAGREYKACCPFHGEKTPSFTVNDDKGFAHCFGCGWHGDVIRFVADYHNLGFVETVEQLAGEAGIEVPAPSAEARRHAERIAGQRPTLEAAADLYRDLLRDHGAAREWVIARGIDLTVEVEFGLGFAPEDGALRGRGFNRGDLVAVGLVGAADDRSGGTFHYPRFRSRIMIPIHDARGQIVGFGGRTVPGAKEGAAKYINSPDSTIFDKGGLLFNLHRAREPFRVARRLILVEGYFDVIALHRLGLAAVAPMGTALTERQLERAWRVDPCPLLLFDGDAAGMKAAVRACETALPMLGPGRSLSIGAMPPGMDPDEIVRASVAAGEDPAMALAAWLAVNPPRSVQECLFDHAAASVEQDGPDAWADVWHRLSAWGELIADEARRITTMTYWRRRWEVAGALAIDNVKEVDDPEWQAELVRLGFEDGTTIEGGDERVQMAVAWLVSEYDAIAEIQDGMKDRLALLKLMGFDPPMLRKIARTVIADRKNPEKRLDKEAREAAYRRAIGLRGPMTEALLPPPFATGGAAREGKRAPALPPPTRRIEAMMDMIEGRG